MDETKNEILTRIDALAAKLGTTAEYLWETIVSDVIRLGWARAIGGALFIVLAALVARWFIARDADEWGDELRFIPAILAGIIIGTTGLVLVCVGVSDLLAPRLEAWKILTGG